MRGRSAKWLVAVGVAALVSACASVPGPRDPRDPWESYNRAMFAFNDGVDRAIVRPLAEGYVAVVPSPARHGIGNFLANLNEVVVALNDLLQGKPGHAINDAARVVVNSTLGIVGLFDVASRMGLPKRNEDFGQTLGRWGVGTGPYFVIPVLGASSLRDAPARLVDMQVSPIHNHDEEGIRTSLLVLDAIDTRADLLPADRLLDEAGGDRYVVVRDAWLSRREYLVHDGNPPARDAGDNLLRDLEEMESGNGGGSSLPPPPAEEPAPEPPSDEGVPVPEAAAVAWVRAQNPASYTVQLAGFVSRSGPEDFARRHRLGTDWVKVRTRRGAQDWYLMILGSYPDVASARRATAALPHAVRANGAWIRSFGSISATLPDV